MEFLKTITGRIVTGLVALGVLAGGISWWRMDEASRHALAMATGHVLLWLGVVVVWPWVSFALISRVAKAQSNLAGAALVASYTLVEAGLLAWLLDWHVSGAAAWTFLILGVLVAGAYNLLACDWIAEKLT